jgi:NAD-dependent deacetylase
VASPEGWANNREIVLDFYNERRKQTLFVSPNAGHSALVDLAKNNKVVITTQGLSSLTQL